MDRVNILILFEFIRIPILCEANWRQAPEAFLASDAERKKAVTQVFFILLESC